MVFIMKLIENSFLEEENKTERQGGTFKENFLQRDRKWKGVCCYSCNCGGDKMAWSPVGDDEMRRHPDSQAGRVSSASLCRSPSTLLLPWLRTACCEGHASSPQNLSLAGREMSATIV